ncbi:hypothetical protein ACOCGP_003544 [Vibrio cholerae]|uniref:hypothetical protein n=2 Tax=Vibrio cholerae TaxID=666 RepID=UPI001157BEEE|nr:hypothetical protein [Vibrio cholerae]ELE2135094.1 hypothetical protein [Vibrio cholerae]MCD1189587.1 hypothetical protein [Vibrio cholerae]TQP79966.1 hypothetical protein FLL88_13275 [Vibrio cholerae]HAS3656608.1 hypothetical protein [Vibrio cholerae]HDG1730797.1 hypothetical protein [Vibrio cholerae]
MSAVGIGGIAVKLIDITILQKYLYQKRVSDWLRQQRYEAFSRLTSDIISYGLDQPETLKSMPESMGLAASAILLIDNEELSQQIQHFIFERHKLELLEDKGKEAEAIELFKDLEPMRHKIILGLKAELRNSQI